MAGHKDKDQIVADTRAKVREARGEIEQTKRAIATTKREVGEVTDHILGGENAIARSLKNLNRPRGAGGARKNGPPKG
jgi:hypothetical protein